MKNKRLIGLVIAPLLLVLSACGGSSVKVDNLNVAGFAKEVDKAGVVVLDVRTPGEFAVGHIKGAINIDVEAGDFDANIAKLDKAKEYAVYCHSGRRSGIATEKMSKSGFTDLKNLNGGIQDWQAAGYTLVTN